MFISVFVFFLNSHWNNTYLKYIKQHGQKQQKKDYDKMSADKR